MMIKKPVSLKLKVYAMLAQRQGKTLRQFENAWQYRYEKDDIEAAWEAALSAKTFRKEGENE